MMRPILGVYRISHSKPSNKRTMDDTSVTMHQHDHEDPNFVDGCDFAVSVEVYIDTCPWLEQSGPLNTSPSHPTALGLRSAIQ